MKKLIVPFSGISRNTDDAISIDGQCMELINARVKNGSIQPIGKPIQLKAFGTNFAKGFFHPLAKRYVFIREDDGSLMYSDENYNNLTHLSNTVLNTQHVEFVGYILCALTTNGIFYFNFKNEQYKYIGDKPNYNISIWACEDKDMEIKDDFTFKYTEGTIPQKMDYRDVPSFLDFLSSNKDRTLDPYKNEGRLSEPICVRAALRTYNGSYIAHSPIYLLFPKQKTSSAGYLDDITRKFTQVGQNPPEAAITIQQTIKTYRIKYQFSFDDMEVWKDIVTSLDIFVSKPISIIDSERLSTTGINIAPETPLINVYSKKVMGEKIIQAASSLYLSESVTSNYGDGYLKPGDVSAERLIDDAFYRNSMFGYSSFVYNNRLHIANIKNILFKGFGSELFLSPEYISYNGYMIGSTLMKIKAYTFINTESGEKIVLHEGNALNPLSPLFCYPDYRASKVIIYAMIAGVGGTSNYRKVEFELSKGELNIAYYLSWDHDYDRVSPFNLMEGTIITESQYNNPDIAVNNIEYSPNKIKVSDLNNPFIFPVEQTYTVSNQEIIGLAAVTSALSTGQFGQFPLYVFSSDGIYALSVGSTSTVYSTSHPVSRDVCTTQKSIISIDNAIVFCTETGVMLLTGSSVKKLSNQLEGYLPSSFSSSPLLNKILTIPKLQASTAEFRDYISSAVAGYIYEEKEIIISNKLFSYSYVFNLQSNEWSKLSYSVNSFLNSYPRTLAICFEKSGCGIYNLANNHRTINNIAIITRPIKLGSITHKRIIQSSLRGIIKPSLSDVYFRGEPVQFREKDVQVFSETGFYILGSNDAEHFTLLSGVEKIKDIRDLITKMNKTKAYKYFIFCLVGGVRTDVAINYIELMVDETYTNRLR